MADPVSWAETYRRVVLAHHREPRNRGPLAAATHQALGHNVLCGDRITPTLFKGKPVEGALRLAESLLDTRQPSAALSRQT